VKQRPLVLAILALTCGACGDDGTTNGPINGPTSQPPTVSSINPTSGTTLGGTAVTVTGTNFASGASLTLGAVSATNVSVSSSTTLTGTTGARAAGRVEVVVRNPNGQSSTLGNGFEYVVVPVLRADPGGPYSIDAGRNLTVDGRRSTSTPFPIAHYFRNCGQTPHGKPCTPDSPTPVFEYMKTGKIGSPNQVYTITLTIEDTMGNRSSPATTTVSVRQAY
jgi:hypothetical protein